MDVRYSTYSYEEDFEEPVMFQVYMTISLAVNFAYWSSKFKWMKLCNLRCYEILKVDLVGLAILYIYTYILHK